MTRVKITVIKKFSANDVFGPSHEVKSLSGKPVTDCHLFQIGDEFMVDNIEEMPNGFCGWAWRDIYKDLSVLYFDGDFYRPEKGAAYVSCTDGRKPVVFKLERLD